MAVLLRKNVATRFQRGAYLEEEESALLVRSTEKGRRARQKLRPVQLSPRPRAANKCIENAVGQSGWLEAQQTTRPKREGGG